MGLCHYLLLMNHLHNRGLEGSFYRDKCINSEIVSTTHPLTDFRFLFTEKQCKILLLQPLLYKNFVDSIHNLERQVYRLTNLRIHLSATILQNTTPSHNA